jgi:hypothetical protein
MLLSMVIIPMMKSIFSNLVENYGWPYVSGYNDNKAYQYYNWSAAENCQDPFNDIAFAPPGVPVSNEK